MADVSKWLESLGLGQYAGEFEENAIDWEVLPELNYELLRELGVTAVGHRVRILKAVDALGSELASAAEPLPTTPVPTQQSAPTVEPERRQLTVMFCDLVGSTTLAERLDPEELHALLAQYQDTCAEVIQRYEGHIARYVGDGLLVYFGYPQAHEDDPQRAVRTGLGIVEAIKDLDAKFTITDMDLDVRIGFTSGFVVAGDIVSGERREENAIVG